MRYSGMMRDYRISYDRLVGDHERIAELVSDLRNAARSGPGAREDALNLLLQLAVQLATHLAYEDEVADLTLIAGAAGIPQAETRAMVAELAALRVDWDRYVSRWSPDEVRAHWAEFADDTQAVLERIAAQVNRENDLLYAPALRQGIATRREASSLH